MSEWMAEINKEMHKTSPVPPLYTLQYSFYSIYPPVQRVQSGMDLTQKKFLIIQKFLAALQLLSLSRSDMGLNTKQWEKRFSVKDDI